MACFEKKIVLHFLLMNKKNKIYIQIFDTKILATSNTNLLETKPAFTPLTWLTTEERNLCWASPQRWYVVRATLTLHSLWPSDAIWWNRNGQRWFRSWLGAALLGPILTFHPIPVGKTRYTQINLAMIILYMVLLDSGHYLNQWWHSSRGADYKPQFIII